MRQNPIQHICGGEFSIAAGAVLECTQVCGGVLTEKSVLKDQPMVQPEETEKMNVIIDEQSNSL